MVCVLAQAQVVVLDLGQVFGQGQIEPTHVVYVFYGRIAVEIFQQLDEVDVPLRYRQVDRRVALGVAMVHMSAILKQNFGACVIIDQDGKVNRARLMHTVADFVWR